jgi:hypothetical protein
VVVVVVVEGDVLEQARVVATSDPEVVVPRAVGLV